MKQIDCYDKSSALITKFTQWDKNQIIYIDDLENSVIPRVHFALQSNENLSFEYKDITTLETDGRIKVKIPNEFLYESVRLFLFFCYEDEDTLTTKYFTSIQVKSKPKPDDYVYETNADVLEIKATVNEQLTLINDTLSSFATMPDTGKVGQILEIESVDINGKPTSYIAVDKPTSETDNETSTGIGLTERQILALDAMFNVCTFNKDDISEEYNEFKEAFGISSTILATGISLDNTELEITTSENQTVIATVIPSNTTETVVWTSDNESIVTVDNGVITPIANGSATITATIGSYSASCSVVVNIEEETTLVFVENVDTIEGKLGTVREIAVIVSPSDLAESVVWESSDTGIITIEEESQYAVNGVSGVPLISVSNGTATITATVNGVSISCEVTVDYVPLEGISIDSDDTGVPDISISSFSEISYIYITLEPSNATIDDDDTFIIDISDESVVTIEEVESDIEGKFKFAITPIANGATNVHFYLNDCKARCTVSVAARH